MDEFEESDNYSIITDYDDGVVCFGAETQSQIERYKRLPRHTVLPSDIQLSESFLKPNEDDVGNDLSTSILDKSRKNTKIPIDDSINDKTDTTKFLNIKETSTVKLKQSSTNDSSYVFSSPVCTKPIPSEKLLDTETINRYIRMGSLSPNESFSEDQNKSAFAEDETVSDIDVQESELSTNNCVYHETSSCRPSVSSMVEQSVINNHKISDRGDNVCTLKHCNQQEDEDITYCCDSEFGDDDNSIVADKYSITPGKQRLFDSRLAKSSIRAKTIASAPFMDRIDESTTPLPKALNSPIKEVSYRPLENEDNLDTTSVTSLSNKSSMHFNQSSSDWDIKSKNSINEVVGELSESAHFNHSVSKISFENCVDYTKSAIVGMVTESLCDNKVEKTYGNNVYTKLTQSNTFSDNKNIVDVNFPLNVVNDTLINTSNDIDQTFDTHRSMNMFNLEVSTANIDYNNEEKSDTEEVDIKSTIKSVMHTISDETICSSILSSNGISKDLDKSSNETSQVSYSSNIAEHSFGVEKSMCNMSNFIVSNSTADVNSYINEDESEAMEIDIKSTNASFVNKVFDETMCISMLSTNDKSKDFDESLNETTQVKDTSNIVEPSSDVDKSMVNISNTIVTMTNVSDYNNEESSTKEVDVKTTNNSVVNEVFDETMCISMLSTNDKSKDLDESLNETTQVKDTSNIVEPSSDVDKSMVNISNAIVTMTNVSDYNNEEESSTEEVDVKTTNTSVVKEVFDETMCISMLSTNDKSNDFDESLNETTQVKDTSNIVKLSSDVDKSMDNISNTVVTMPNVSDYNNEEESSTEEVDVKTTNTSVVNEVFDETMCISMLSTNDKSKDFDESPNEDSQVTYTSSVAEHSFYVKKNMSNMSNLMVPTADINGYNNEKENKAMEVNTNSTNSSFVIRVFDNTVCTSMVSTNNISKYFEKSLNETTYDKDTSNIVEPSSDVDKSMVNISNAIVTMTNVSNYNNEESSTKEVDVKTTNKSVVNEVFDETMCISMLSTNDKSNDFEESLNETTQVKDTSNIVELSSNVEKSMDNIPNVIASMTDIIDYNNVEESRNKEVDVQTTNASFVKKVFDETMCISMLSTNDKSEDLSKSFNETTQVKDISNIVEQSFDVEKSLSNMSEIIVSVTDHKYFNNEELYTKEEDIKSLNTSVINKIPVETMCTDILSSTSINKDFDKPLNGITLAKDTSNVAEHSFYAEENMSNMSNLMVLTADINSFNNDDKSEALEVDIESTNTSHVDKLFDETMSPSMLSTYCKSNNFDKLLNETTQANDTSNVDNENSINILPNVIIPMANNYISEEESNATEVAIKTTNTSIVNKISDETMCTSMLSTNGKTKDFNRSLNETSQTKDTSNVTEHIFDVKKSLDNKVVSSLNDNDTLQLSKFRDNTLKYSTDIEMPCSEKVDMVFSNEISETYKNTSEDISNGMRQYLEFEQTIYNMCNNLSSENLNTNLNKSSICGDQTMENISMIEQTLCSDISIKDEDNLLSENLSVIIENRTLEENCNDNERFENLINDTSTSSVLKDNINDIQDNEKLNKSTILNKIESIISENVLKSELNGTDHKFEIKSKSNESSYLINNINSCLPINENKGKIIDITIDEKLVEMHHNESSVLSDEISKIESCKLAEVENYLNNKSVEEKCFVSKNVNEIYQNTINKNDLCPMHIDDNTKTIPNLTAIECTLKSKNINKNSVNPSYNAFLNINVQQFDLICTDKNIDDSLTEYNKLEQMCNFEEDKKLQTFDYTTPKTQKLLDCSIMQQTPNFLNQAKQKLLNFSIVDQTPTRKSTQVTNLDENTIGKKDTLIDFSAVDQMWDLDVMSPEKIDFKNTRKGSLMKNLSAVSAPDVELLTDESIKTNSLNTSDLSLNRTITDANLNMSSYSDKINESKDNIGETNVISSNKDYCFMPLINEKIDSELSNKTESKHNKYCYETCINETKEILNPTGYKLDLNQPSTFNSNSCAIKDFSIIDQQILPTPDSTDSKVITNKMSVESAWNVSNLIEMSVVSKIDEKSNDQVSFATPVNDVTSDSKSEKSINSSSDDHNTTIHIEEHLLSHNPEFLTDIQMNDVSLIESIEKSLNGESFHSIESDQLPEDNKRKIEADREHNVDYENHEKKIKLQTEVLSTPMSMLYKLRNIFKSSEKRPIYTNNTKENDLKSDKCHQKLNFSKVEGNKNESMNYKKPEVLVKSKIPCKISDRSMSKNNEFNNSSSSLNDSIKPKKGIPRFIGAPVLSDVSNSSNRKCPESRIPSTLKK